VSTYPGCNGHRIKARCALAGGPHPGKAPARQLDRLLDLCPKLQGLHAGSTHVVRDYLAKVRNGTNGRCVYCSRTIDLSPAVEPAAGQLELELPEPRSCASCGSSLEGFRPQATTCSAACRQRLARSRRPEPVAKEPGLCRFCRRQLTSSRASTCSTRCRSAMHRSRSSALDTTHRTRLSPADLFRLQAAHAPDAPAPMRVAGAAFWACRCGTVVRDTSTSCGFCGGMRPQPLLLEVLEGWAQTL